MRLKNGGSAVKSNAVKSIPIPKPSRSEFMSPKYDIAHCLPLLQVVALSFALIAAALRGTHFR